MQVPLLRGYKEYGQRLSLQQGRKSKAAKVPAVQAQMDGWGGSCSRRNLNRHNGAGIKWCRERKGKRPLVLPRMRKNAISDCTTYPVLYVQQDALSKVCAHAALWTLLCGPRCSIPFSRHYFPRQSVHTACAPGICSHGCPYLATGQVHIVAAR